MNIERTAWVDSNKYQFCKEEHALLMINDAIKLGVLLKGPNGGVMVYKEFDDGSEGWQEVDKAFAAKDLVKQNMVNTLCEAIDNHKSKQSLAQQIESASSRVIEAESPNKLLAKESAPER